MTHDEMAPSPWSMVPNSTQMAQAQTAMAQTPQFTPDQLYPSFPNPAGLGTGVPFETPPQVVPVPAYGNFMQTQAPIEMEQQMLDPDMGVSPWSMLRGEENGY